MNSFRYNRCEGLWGGESDYSSSMEAATWAKRWQGLSGRLDEQPLPAATTSMSGAGFSVRCFWSAKGKLLRKDERGPLGRTVWTYSFDDRGHLLEARKDGIPVERYAYNEAGQRIADHLTWLGEPRQFIYYYDGSLIRLDDEYLAWTEKGQLQAIYDRSRRCGYAYGTDTRLDSVFLPSGKVIAYEYGKELMPVRITEDSEAAAEYEWEGLLQLIRYIDIRNGLVYTFSYGKGRAPETVTITGRPDAMEAVTGFYTGSLALHIGVDQVDSIRLLATPEGRAVKYVEYDSFGNVTRDSRPVLHFPLGFACGLNDVYTGFVRFGFRDYHPPVGRFTAKDPVGYTGGDNDLWDYCVDDPVSCSDPLGLWTQENFDEAKVERDEDGKFASNGSTGDHEVDPADIRRLSEYLKHQAVVTPKYGWPDALKAGINHVNRRRKRASLSTGIDMMDIEEFIEEAFSGAGESADALEFIMTGKSEGKTGTKTREALAETAKRLREKWPMAKEKFLQGWPKIGDGLSRLPEATGEHIKRYRDKTK